MFIKQITSRLKNWYLSKTCVYFRGPTGIGKTEVVVDAVPQLAKLLGKNLGMVIINGGCLTITDATGYLVPVQLDGVQHSEFTKPFWWRTQEGKPLEAYDGGLIIIDEADKVNLDEKKILGEGALSGRLASHTLPPGWLIWMTGNRAEDRSGSTKELDHLINRRQEINVEFHLDSWMEWAFQHGMSPEVLTFAEQNPHLLMEGKAPEKQGPYITARSLTNTDRYLRLLAEDNGGVIPTDPVTIEEVGGRIGQGAATQLFATIRLGQEMPKFQDIVEKPTTVKVPEKPDARMLVCYNLAMRVDEGTANSVVTYMKRMPKEFATTFVKASVKRDPTLIYTDAFDQWCNDNSALLAAIVDRR